MKQRLVLLLLTIQAVLPAKAQPVSSMRTFTVNDGLPSNAITSIKQDCHGLIWIATWNGLCCYDGYRFTAFHGDEWGSANALSTQRISSIEPDSQDNIWVRTYDGGLYLFDTHQCRYVNMGFQTKQRFGDGFNPSHLYAIAGKMWIASDKDDRVLWVDDRYATAIDSFRAVEGKHFWENVLPKKSSGTIAHEESAAERYVREHGIDKHFMDQQGNLWFVSPQGGLSLVSFRHPPIRLLQATEGNSQTRSIVCRNDGSIWTGARNGMLTVFNSEGQLVNRKSFIPNMYVMHEDRQGNLWIGTRGDGLYVMDAGGRTVGHYTHNDDLYSISNNDIYDIAEDEAGNIWIATWGGGVNLVKSDKSRFLHKGNEMTGYPKEGFDKVRRITHDGQGTMIVSTTWGLLTFDTSNNQTLHFHTTRQVPNDTTSLRANDVMQVLVCRNGDIYVATMGGGVQKIISEHLLQDTLKFQTVRGMNEGRGNVLSMVEDRQGNIWIVRESQVNCYNVKTGQLEQYGPNSMSEAAELTEAKPAIDNDGNIWIGAIGGVMTFNAGQISKSSYRPNIVFTGIRYQGEQQERPILNRQILFITDKHQRSLTIGFAALDYGDNYLLQYAYRLKETDANWNYIGHDPHIAFSQLPPGRHTLIVRSTNCDGVWMDNDTEIVIEIEPMLWERTWVRLIALLLAVGLTTWAVMAWLGHRRKMREREQRMESILQQYGNLNDNPNANHQYKLAEPQIVNEDEVMMNRLMDYIEKRIGDDTMKIEDMADAVGLSRTVFYEKIRELVGVSPSDFLRQVRMERACQLITRSKMPFSQIAYAVGFTDPKYFTKCFKKQTGMTPSEYRKKEADSQ